MSPSDVDTVAHAMHAHDPNVAKDERCADEPAPAKEPDIIAEEPAPAKQPDNVKEPAPNNARVEELWKKDTQAILVKHEKMLRDLKERLRIAEELAKRADERAMKLEREVSELKNVLKTVVESCESKMRATDTNEEKQETRSEEGKGTGRQKRKKHNQQQQQQQQQQQKQQQKVQL
jgi:hypothetical protein